MLRCRLLLIMVFLCYRAIDVGIATCRNVRASGVRWLRVSGGRKIRWGGWNRLLGHWLFTDSLYILVREHGTDRKHNVNTENCDARTSPIRADEEVFEGGKTHSVLLLSFIQNTPAPIPRRGYTISMQRGAINPTCCEKIGCQGEENQIDN